MSPKLNEQSNEQTQAAVMEKDPITELFVKGNEHLQNLENNISTFLKEHGIIGDDTNPELDNKIKSYDGKIEGENINNFEKLKILKQTLNKEKKDIVKHHLVMQIISHTMSANSKDNIDLLKILKANDKKELFGDIVKIKNQELNEYRKDLITINNKYKKDIGYVEPKSKEQNIAEISNGLKESIQKISKNPNDKLAIKEFETNIQKSKDLGVDKEISEDFGKYLEYSMQSGVLPLALMSNGTLRKALPMLPSVIGLGVWSRLMHGTMSDKASALGETALAIAPITGTRVAYKDAMKAEGTGNKVAAWTGFAVSAGFDAFSVFLVATGIGAPAAIGTQALKITAKESVKLGVKKLFSFFSKEVVQEAPRAYGTLGKISKEYVKGKISVVTNAVKEVGITKFIAKLGQQSLKDTVEGLWSIISFKGLRELKYIKSVLNKPFEYTSKKLAPGKIKTFEMLEKKGFVKEGATKRLKMAGTVEETKLISHEYNENVRPEDISTLNKENELYHYNKEVSTQKLNELLKKIDDLAKNPNTNSEILKNTLEALKKQDEILLNKAKENNTVISENSIQIVKTFETLISNSKINSKNKKIILKGYLDIIKNAEKTGLGSARMEKTTINGKIDSSNGYEYLIKQLLLKKKINKITLFSQLDLSLIHDKEIIKDIVNSGFIHIGKIYKNSPTDAFKLIDIFSNSKTKDLLKNKFYGINIISENGVIKGQKILEELSKTESNRDLLKLIDYIKNGANRNYVKSKILNNVVNNDQINGNIGENIFFKNQKGEEVKPITREALDKGLKELAKLGEPEYKYAFNTIIKKINGNTKAGESIKEEPTSKEIKLFTEKIESYEVAATFCKHYPEHSGLVSKQILEGTHTSIEYKIKFLIEGDNLNIPDSSKNIETFKNKFTNVINKLNEKIQNSESIEYSSTIKSLDNIEAFFKNSKNGGEISNKEILDSIAKLKESTQYKNQDIVTKETLELLLNLDKNHNADFLKSLKNSGKITYKTKEKISLFIEKKAIIGDDGVIIRELNKSEVEKLKIVKEQVKVALDKYEFNLFDEREYTDGRDKSVYLYNIIDQKSGWNLSGGTEKNGKLVKEITRQLNTLTNNFRIEPTEINNVIYKILDNQNNSSLTVGNKIHLLKLLEKVGVIKPSIEQKLEFLTKIESKTSSDFRQNIVEIKEYTKDFEKKLKTGNDKIQKLIEEKNIKEIEKYIIETKDQRVSVDKSYLDGKELIEGLDYIKLKNKDGKEEIFITKVYPSRYFMSKLLEPGIDLRQKEAYMELIANTSDFGGKTIKEYFNEATDIETKLLLSYHKDLKYEKEGADMLLKYSSNPKYTETIQYIITKRDDLSLLKNSEGTLLTKEFLEKTITKEKLEAETGEKYTDDEFKELKIRYIKLIITTKDINKLNTISKGLIHEINKEKEGKAIMKTITVIETNLPAIKTAFKNNLRLQAEKLTQIDLTRSMDNIYDGILLAMQENPKIVQNPELLNKTIIKLIDGKIDSDILSKIGISKSQLTDDIKSNFLTLVFAGRVGLQANESFRNVERAETKLIARKAIAALTGTTIFNSELRGGDDIKLKNNMKRDTNILEANIADTWEKSPKYPEYLKAMETGDITAAMKIKKEAINQITKMVLKAYIADFKDKYEARYLSKFQEFPLGLRDLTATIHEKLSPMVKDKTVKGRNAFAQSIYFFINNYYKENGKAEKYARKLLDKVEGGQSSPIADLIINMGKQSDIEAAKSPEQKKKEHEEFIRRQHEIQIKENAKQAKIRKEIDASQRNIDASQRNIDASQRNIDASQRNIDAEKRKQEIRIKIQNMMNSI